MTTENEILDLEEPTLFPVNTYPQHVEKKIYGKYLGKGSGVQFENLEIIEIELQKGYPLMFYKFPDDECFWQFNYAASDENGIYAVFYRVQTTEHVTE